MDVLEVQQLLPVLKEADDVQFYYSVYLYSMLVVSLASTVIIVVNWKNFQNIKREFRPFLFHTIGASIFTMIAISLCQPVAILPPPLIGGYSIGILALLGPDGFLFGLWIAGVSVSHLGMSIASAFWLQSYQLKVGCLK